MALQKVVGPTSSCSLLCTLPSFSPSCLMGKSDHPGMRQAPECLDSAHISVRLWELLKAENRRFYRCSAFAGTGPSAISIYNNTAGRREAIVSTCPPLFSRFMIKVSTGFAFQCPVFYRRRFSAGILPLAPRHPSLKDSNRKKIIHHLQRVRCPLIPIRFHNPPIFGLCQ